MELNLTSAEQAIMSALWEGKHWMTINELIECCSHLGKTWKRQTVNTFLTRLIEKGLVVKNGRKYIYAYSKEEYEAQKASQLLDTFYNGSLRNFVVALSGNCSLDAQDIKELREYLDTFQDQRKD
ncbi:MAG: BlaI/MecI/CopY family transcriptional regulator [Hungatella sp.]|nr:BlaI/MecI/CopY family transcriptional regulator [Hungatella sp.]